jgi:NADPH-dependent 2,4-dienoyl-CoA reductase/sulfur reductase-like enzyme
MAEIERSMNETAYNTELLANVRPPDWTNPQPASSYNLVVIGAGTAGLVTAAAAAALGAKVALVERSLLGGDPFFDRLGTPAADKKWVV